MNIWGLNALGRAPMRLWRRFQIWRAHRIYAGIPAKAEKLQRDLHKADLLMRKHAEDPQRRLPLGDD
jgi:hypothetical protein